MSPRRPANPILNYTTKVDAGKTISEIACLLSAKHAIQISTDYSGGKGITITFVIMVAGQRVSFRLEPNVTGVMRVLGRGDRVQAERVAWRILLRWVEAQMAMVESSQAEMGQIFLPYAIVNEDGGTLWGQFESRQAARQLTDGGGK